MVLIEKKLNNVFAGGAGGAHNKDGFTDFVVAASHLSSSFFAWICVVKNQMDGRSNGEKSIENVLKRIELQEH